MEAERFHGIYPILYAFFDPEGTPLRDPLIAQVEAAVPTAETGIASAAAAN